MAIKKIKFKISNFKHEIMVFENKIKNWRIMKFLMNVLSQKYSKSSCVFSISGLYYII